MSPSDFDIPDAEAALEVLFQKAQGVPFRVRTACTAMPSNAEAVSIPNCAASSTGAGTATEPYIWYDGKLAGLPRLVLTTRTGLRHH